jgi:hypothetical protein
MVRNYTDQQIFDRIKSLPSYNPARGIPDRSMVLVISNEDTPNGFDDKLYPYKDGVNPFVVSCTGNPGTPVLTGGWKKYSPSGAAIIARDECYYDAYRKTDGKTIRHHKDRMPGFRLVKNIKYYRDNDNDNKAEQLGKPIIGNYSTNIHFNTYTITDKLKNAAKSVFSKVANSLTIGWWSAGCIVLNVEDQYRRLYEMYDEKPITLFILTEWEP